LLPRQQENVTNTNILIITTTNMLYKSNMVNKHSSALYPFSHCVFKLHTKQDRPIHWWQW